MERLIVLGELEGEDFRVKVIELKGLNVFQALNEGTEEIRRSEFR
jgi:hypothetical protein